MRRGSEGARKNQDIWEMGEDEWEMGNFDIIAGVYICQESQEGRKRWQAELMGGRFRDGSRGIGSSWESIGRSTKGRLPRSHSGRNRKSAVSIGRSGELDTRLPDLVSGLRILVDQSFSRSNLRDHFFVFKRQQFSRTNDYIQKSPRSGYIKYLHKLSQGLAEWEYASTTTEPNFEMVSDGLEIEDGGRYTVSKGEENGCSLIVDAMSEKDARRLRLSICGPSVGGNPRRCSFRHQADDGKLGSRRDRDTRDDPVDRRNNTPIGFQIDNSDLDDRSSGPPVIGLDIAKIFTLHIRKQYFNSIQQPTFPSSTVRSTLQRQNTHMRTKPKIISLDSRNYIAITVFVRRVRRDWIARVGTIEPDRDSIGVLGRKFDGLKLRSSEGPHRLFGRASSSGDIGETLIGVASESLRSADRHKKPKD
ncbi:hypothetical protein SISNIDRAFT_471606 [Sistotremastrum niveocremeum HHB9708]|uniref:Uncharacterized protein n=1 Tax=Sistotremastrum niveocremeum HHB9708 TaxID=1314777 RepID=A0A164MF74_9AGAM|nr:hypothetical protein SISNIDRAFT_471606 [Sistotremastrum niveocremeum HHB9708]